MADTADIWAVVPIKPFNRAKQRLAPAYSAAFRAGLASAMAEDVIAALMGVRELSGILVVTNDPTAAELTIRYGAIVTEEGADIGYAGAVSGAAQRLAREGRTGMLAIPGDVPLVTAAEVSRLIQGHPAAPSFSIVPAHDRRGSNAILCSPPECVPACFGPDSFYRHLAAAEKSEVRVRAMSIPGLELDIDEPEDLKALIKRPPTRTRTWAFLASQEMVEPFAETSAAAV